MISLPAVVESSRIADVDGFSRNLAGIDIPYCIFAQPDVIRILRLRPDNLWLLLEALSLDDWLRAIANCTKSWIDIFGDKAGTSHARVYIGDRLNAVSENFPALRCTMEWLQYALMGAMRQSVIDAAKYQNQGAQALLDTLWRGPESLIQRHLLQRHSMDDVWPNSSFLISSWAEFTQDASPKIMQVLLDKSKMVNGLFWGEAGDYRFMVANLPVLLGLWSMTGTPMTWWHQQQRLAIVEQVRAFNSAWFDLAYQHGVQMAVVLGIHLGPIKEGSTS